jgi:Protein of unknown function (DUF2690)
MGMTVQLRYSPTCRAAWARVFNAGRGTINQFFVRDEEGSESPDLRIQDQPNPAVQNFSPMLNTVRHTVEACVADAADYFVCTKPFTDA